MKEVTEARVASGIMGAVGGTIVAVIITVVVGDKFKVGEKYAGKILIASALLGASLGFYGAYTLTAKLEEKIN